MSWYNPFSWDWSGKQGDFSEAEKEDQKARMAQMRDALGYMRGQAQGQNSIAAEQLRQGLQQNVSAQQALAASARPGQGGMAQRMASQQAGKMGAELSGQQALARLMEQKQAQQMYADLLARMRGQDYGYRAVLAGQPENWERFMGGVKGVADLYLQSQNPQQKQSDIRAKEQIAPGGPEAQRLLDGLRPQTFRYKDEARNGPGRQLGVMAQDLEKSNLGQQAVSEGPRGKMVDTGKLTMGLAAGLAQLNDRLKKVEGKPKKEDGYKPYDREQELERRREAMGLGAK